MVGWAPFGAHRFFGPNRRCLAVLARTAAPHRDIRRNNRRRSQCRGRSRSTIFAEKLGVMLDRLSLSRVQLAQLAGVVKSVSGRWASGRAGPGEQSLVRPTDIARCEISDFSRDEWNPPVGAFAARLGLPGRSAAAMPGGFARDPDPEPAAAVEAAQRYSGLWLLAHPAYRSPARSSARASSTVASTASARPSSCSTT